MWLHRLTTAGLGVISASAAGGRSLAPPYTSWP
ncbi:hypothetical protein E2C01_092754 [Portunus trituberculatus]|uniref:Uncharacterized protein n=1 Tax=Portunus trituberculatus TaxID=210409 RepID=A0A5B7JWR1_PORTR|nr:hypothetical protein [Portunus trituberculatus]